MAEWLDLFGDPVNPRIGLTGRPRHMPTAATRARVRELRAEGKSILAIGAALGISHPTLALNYPQELGSASQAWRRRAERETKGTEMLNGPEPAWRSHDKELRATGAPMRGGAGRWTRLRAALAVLNPLDRKLLLEALDEATRPMQPGEIDAALIPSGLSEIARERVVGALDHFPVLLAIGTTSLPDGAARLARMLAALETLSLLERKRLMEALEEVMRPMNVREIEEALLPSGLGRSDRKRLVNALKGLPILLVARP